MTRTFGSEQLEREAMTDFPEVAGWLQDNLGARLTAYVAGLRDTKAVGRWRRGGSPRPSAEFRARIAYTAARMLVDAYGPATARAWLLGSSCRLDDEAPAWLLRHADGPGDVRFLVAAARAFAGKED